SGASKCILAALPGGVHHNHQYSPLHRLLDTRVKPRPGACIPPLVFIRQQLPPVRTLSIPEAIAGSSGWIPV
ncbi:hypothetical protein, partial [Azotobacter chroococcum]|uniref:hypothetical protein n=1 Tax=Azotobacter chroococcum TaxID=353 RepID=UPI00361F9F41